MNLVVLGASGSIGSQTLDVCRKNSDKISVVGIAVNSNCAMALQAVHEFGIKHVALGKANCKDTSEVAQMREMGVEVTFGPQAVAALAQLPEADCVLNALVGAAGLHASYDALASGKRLALANKESLVVGGDLIMPLSKSAELLPVDSEHGAIYQCLVGEKHDEVSRLWVTASGGPFRGMTREQLEQVTCEQALAHPTWKMGPKITIDSATLMNKGLEVIEAHHLFTMPFDRIEVVVQPQSCIHSMVEYCDGSVKAHLGVTDMRVPIQYALSYPDRWGAPLEPLDFRTLGHLDFAAADTGVFRCLALALEAGRTGGTAPCVLNAANEVAVATFLSGACRITDIDFTVGKVLAEHKPYPVSSLEQLDEVDAWARARAREVLPMR